MINIFFNAKISKNDQFSKNGFKDSSSVISYNAITDIRRDNSQKDDEYLVYYKPKEGKYDYAPKALMTLNEIEKKQFFEYFLLAKKSKLIKEYSYHNPIDSLHELSKKADDIINYYLENNLNIFEL